MPSGHSTSAVAPTAAKLQFNQPLSWKPGKPIPLAELLKRLKALSKELAALDAEAVDRDSLAKSAKELVAPNLLRHKDSGVRAWVACCLADELRVHVPDAPYTLQQLKDIFALFVGQLAGLKDLNAPYHQEYLYILDSLSTVKSIVLLSDIPESDDLVTKLFESFFDTASPEAPKNLEYQMTDVLVQLIDEANSLPANVVDIILAQFLRSTPSAGTADGKKKVSLKTHTRAEKQPTLVPTFPPAYNMARSICAACVDKMSRHFAQYFSEVMVANIPADSGGQDDDDSVLGEDDSEKAKELSKAHNLVTELWKACPGVLQHIIPHLEEELVTESPQLRELAVDSIGQMVFSTESGSNLLAAYPSTWRVWLGRQNDKNPLVRAKWAEIACSIFDKRSEKEVTMPLSEFINYKLLDADEKVRVAACKGIGAMQYSSITDKLLNEPILDPWGGRVMSSLAERPKDRKHAVRAEGMKVLASLWDMAYEDIAASTKDVADQLHDIPLRLVDVLFVNDKDANYLLDQVIFEILLPTNYPQTSSKKSEESQEKDSESQEQNGHTRPVDRDADSLRAERLLILVRRFDTRHKKAFYNLSFKQARLSEVVNAFVKACEEYNGGVMDKNETSITEHLDKLVDYMAQTFPNPLQVSQDFLSFAKWHDRRCYFLFRAAMNPESEFSTVVKAIREIIRRVENSKAMASAVDTIKVLLYRASLLLFNKSIVPAIVETSKSNRMSLGATAHEVLKEISASQPAIFKAHIQSLTTLLVEQAPTSKQSTHESAVDALKACASFAKKYPEDMPQDRKLLQALVAYAINGRHHAAAKYAVVILMSASSRKELYAHDLVKSYGCQGFLAKLATLGQLVILVPDWEEKDVEEILEFAIKDLLLKFRTPARADDPDWESDDKLDLEIQAKLLALRLLVNRLRASAVDADVVSAKKNAEPVFRLLTKLVAADGELDKNQCTPKYHKSRLRLAAGQMLLQLATIELYDNIMSPSLFTSLSFLVQDEYHEVRVRFMKTLRGYLNSNRLDGRYYTMGFLLAFEPDLALKNEYAVFVKLKASYMISEQSHTHVMETNCARLLSLLAQHPDFGTDTDELKDFASYILYYLESVATADNIGLIYHVAQRVKQARDALSKDSNDNLQYLSELAQELIRRYDDAHNFSMQVWPGRLRLPANLFNALPSSEMAQEIVAKHYLPSDMDAVLDSMVKRPGPRKRKSDGALGLDGLPAKKKARTSMASTKTAAVKKEKDKGKEKKKKDQKGSKSRTSAATSSEKPSARRRSGRATQKIAYVEGANSDESGAESEGSDDSVSTY